MKSKHFVLFPLAIIMFIFSECKKKQVDTTATEQTPDPYTYSSDQQSALDIAMATNVVADVAISMESVMDANLLNDFYSAAPATPAGTIFVINDNSARQTVLGWNKTKCLDGKTRDGSIFLYYGPTSGNSTVSTSSDFGFVGSLQFSIFTVNNWKVESFDRAKPMFITNKLLTAIYTPSVTNISWEIAGKLKFTNLGDTSKHIIWDGKITQTVLNTNDPAVFAANRSGPVKWSIAKFGFSGTVTGTTSGLTFSSEITDQLKKDMTCDFTPPGSADVTKLHPLLSGAVTATISNFHPRTLNFGPAAACDNTGTLSFKDETHAVVFD